MYAGKVTAEDLDICARTIWGEGRGESSEGKEAIAWVIRNRVESKSWFGHGFAGVCRKPWQFSCWNQTDPNREKMEALSKDTIGYQQALTAIASAIVGDKDPTNGSCHYHTAAVQPHWITKPVKTIGGHLFYNDID
jgi:N-acetylmuramoyl-L-alanine amidase